MRGRWVMGMMMGGLLAGCPKDGEEAASTAAAEEAMAMEDTDNPLLTPSTLPYGTPDFTVLEDAHYEPAFQAAMEAQLAEVAAITGSDEAPTFDNTVVALQRTGSMLDRVASIFFQLTSAHTNDTLQAVRGRIAPKLAAHEDAIFLDEALFARVQAVAASEEGQALTGEDARLLERTVKRFVRKGAQLDEAGKARLRELNARESELTTAFADAVLAATNEGAVLVTDEAELEGLSDGAKASAKAAAEERGQEGWLLTLSNTTRQGVLTSLEDRDLRERVWRASASRGTSGEHDTRPMVLELVAIRAEKAQLLGYETWAHFVLDDNMAQTPDAVLTMLTDLVPQVVAKAKTEQEALAAAMAEEGVEGPVQPWDWEHYAETVRQARYDVDEAALAPYFPMDRVIEDGLTAVMGELFGIRFEPRPDLPTYHPDILGYEVFDADDEAVGLFFLDPFARDSKRGGAWMNTFVQQNDLRDERPVVLNTLNVAKPAEGEPALMSLDDVTTLFHEFGHGAHGLFSDATYPSLAGTSVPRDYVEFPSQVQEDWALQPEVMGRYARHHETGEPIDPEVVARVLEARQFNQGFETLEYLGAALLDMAWHTVTLDDLPEDVEAFEAQALERFGVDLAAVPPRYRSTYFQHVFAGGYSAGYYAYLWSEVLAADAFAVMQERGGLTRDNGDTLRTEVLSRGNTRDPMESYRAFAGRDPEVGPLLERRGLTE